MTASCAWQHPFDRVEDAAATFDAHDYVADRPLCLTTKLAFDLGKPILLEGEAGVGKTEVAKVLASALDMPDGGMLNHECARLAAAAKRA